MKRKKILLICPHPEDTAPGQRLKYEQYLTYLRSEGYDIDISPFMTLPFWNIVYKKGYFLQKVFWTLMGYLRRVGDLFRLPFYDGIYIFLWVTPFGPPIFERLFVFFNAKVIYDIDDMVFLRHSSSANRFMEVFKGRAKPIYLMKKAKHIIVCTPLLNQFVQQYNPNTTDISSTINTQTYLPINTYSNDLQALTIGWSGSHSTSKYLYLLKDVFLELQKTHSFKLLVIGDPHFEMEGIDLEAIKWESATEVQNLQRIDIGVYPLPDEEWVYGKSGLKALQYMTLGIPTVATAIGANFRVIEDGVSGFLVQKNEEWLKVLQQLLDNPSLRKEIGVKARQRVQDYYSIEANKHKYLDAFSKVFN
ncbi:MAG: glycosyltransferase family 4 protein [Chitinophagales bacterium]